MTYLFGCNKKTRFGEAKKNCPLMDWQCRRIDKKPLKKEVDHQEFLLNSLLYSQILIDYFCQLLLLGRSLVSLFINCFHLKEYRVSRVLIASPHTKHKERVVCGAEHQLVHWVHAHFWYLHWEKTYNWAEVSLILNSELILLKGGDCCVWLLAPSPHSGAKLHAVLPDCKNIQTRIFKKITSP